MRAAHGVSETRFQDFNQDYHFVIRRQSRLDDFRPDPQELRNFEKRRHQSCGGFACENKSS